MMNKKGEGSSMMRLVMGFVLLAVIAVSLLFIWGKVTTGSWQFWNPFVGGETNVQARVLFCNQACNAGLEVDYCRLSNDELIFGKDDPRNGKHSCKDLESYSVGLKSVPCPNFNCAVKGITCEALNEKDCSDSENNCEIKWVGKLTVERYQAEAENNLETRDFKSVEIRTGDVTDDADKTKNFISPADNVIRYCVQLVPMGEVPVEEVPVEGITD